MHQYQKKHSPTHHPDHPIFTSFFHLLQSIASFLFKLHAWQSFCTSSPHPLWSTSAEKALFFTTLQALTKCLLKVTVRYTHNPKDPRATAEADSPQVTVVINPAVGCHYFLPGLQLPSQLQSVTALLLLFWHAPLGVSSAICRHQPTQRAVLRQINCFVQCEFLCSQISLVFSHMIRGRPNGLFCHRPWQVPIYTAW